MREKLNTKIYDVFDYWKDKCITNEGNVEIELDMKDMMKRKQM